MFTVTVTEKGGQANALSFDKNEISIGRIQGNDIVLPKSNISKRHAKITFNNGAFVVMDQKSTNGTYINGKRIDAPYELRAGDRVFVGDFTIDLRTEAAGKKPSSPPPPPPSDAESSKAKAKPTMKSDVLPDEAWGADGGLKDQWSDDWGSDDGEPAKKSDEFASAELLLEPSPTGAARPTAASGAEAKAKAPAPSPAPSVRPTRPMPQSRPATKLDYRALNDLMQDESVTEIFVNNPQQVYVERAGEMTPHEVSFASADDVRTLLDALLAASGQADLQSSPMIDVRLADGTHLSAIMPPLSVNGPAMTLRKKTPEPLLIDDLVAFGSLTGEMAEFLEVCVKAKKSIVVTGVAGAGKTTMLGILASFLPDERIIAVEERSELKLEQKNSISLENRQSNDGGHSFSMQELIRHALRLRPDRLVVGDCRGAEAFDVLCAQAAGLHGTLTAVCANGPQDAVARLEAMLLLAGVPLNAARGEIASGVDIFVHVVRFPDGARRVTCVSEVTGVQGEEVKMQDIFTFNHKGMDSTGRTVGSFAPTGVVPKFFGTLQSLGIEANRAIFQKG